MSEIALRLIKENKKTRSTTLDLGNCGLTKVPEEIGELVWLETLILGDFWSELTVVNEEYTYFVSKKSPQRS
jgi:hypothetical protein